MAEKILKSRILLKYDTVENWEVSTLVLKAGEVAIGTIPSVDGSEPASPVIKVGDGEHTWSGLGYLYAKAADVAAWAKAANKPAYSATEITGLEDFIAGEIQDTNTQYKVVKVSDTEYRLQQKDINGEWADADCDHIIIPEFDTTELEEAIQDNADAIAAINNKDTGILAQAKTYTDDELTFENGITTVNALGGIAANTSLDGKSAIEILDMLLFPYVKQTISNVRGTPNGGTFEHGNNQTITSVSATVTKKSKPITKVELLQGSTVLATKEGDAVKNGGTITFSGLSVPVNSTNVQLKVKATDENGSTVEGSTGAFTFVYPYYYGVCAAGATIDEALVEGLTKDVSGKGQKAYSYTTNNQCAVIAYPKAHGVLKSALDPNAFENIAAFTRSEVKVTGLDGKTQTYYVYVSGAFTGTAFKYTFKH